MRAAKHLIAVGGLASLVAATPVLGREARSAAADGSRMAGACIVRRDAAFARAWLNALPASAEEQALIGASRKDVESCARKGGVTLDATNQPDVRRAVAGELLMRDFPRLPATAPYALGVDPWFVAKTSAAPNARFDRAELRTENFANCVALSRWRDSVALLAAAPGDALTAGEALRPSLSACLVPGLTVTLKIASLRAMLAEAIYHILSVAGPAAAARR